MALREPDAIVLASLGGIGELVRQPGEAPIAALGVVRAGLRIAQKHHQPGQ